MLIKMTPIVDFNLRAAFLCRFPLPENYKHKLQVKKSFASFYEKAACKMLVKLTPSPINCAQDVAIEVTVKIFHYSTLSREKWS